MKNKGSKSNKRKSDKKSTKKSKKIKAKVEDTMKLKTMHLSRNSLEKALRVLSREVSVNSFRRPKNKLHCNHVVDSPNSSVLAVNEMLSHVRLAMLRHDWEEVKSTLPKFFRKMHTQHYIWKTALQVFCHHPNSSAELLQDELQTWLQTTNLSEDRLHKIFCVPEYMDWQSDNNPCEAMDNGNESDDSKKDIQNGKKTAKRTKKSNGK